MASSNCIVKYPGSGSQPCSSTCTLPAGGLTAGNTYTVPTAVTACIQALNLNSAAKGLQITFEAQPGIMLVTSGYIYNGNHSICSYTGKVMELPLSV